MSDADRIIIPRRTNPIVREILTSWRRLTGGSDVRDSSRRTLVACSGGADSSALLLALAAVHPGPEVCHAVHDMRSAEEAEAEAQRTHAFCDQLGVQFHRVHVAVTGEPGNAESVARQKRYAAMEELAVTRGLRYIATGHHADDQLETVLMRLIRGAGVRGMAGIRPEREIGSGVRIVRPMLGVTHEQAMDLCACAGWRWNEDATNADRTRLRAALRADVLPALRAIEPDVARRATSTCASMASADEAIEAWATNILEHASHGETNGHKSVAFELEKLVVLPSSVLVSLIGLVYTQIVGESGRDRLSRRALNTCISGFVSKNRAVHSYELAEMTVQVSLRTLTFYKK